ncbi:MAG TPA: DUF4232 domain-containing protein [Acidimicrobiales bacterium]|nr:DUF4232 domain-containing protein [Acidimicrobiales bacterium]
MRRGLTSVAIFVAFVVILTLSRHIIDTPSSTTTTTTATTTTTSLSTTTTSALATASTCKGSDFTGIYNEGQGAAGTVYASVTLTKHTAGSCSVKGWPILTLQDKTGAVLELSQVNETGSANAVQFTPAKANEAPSALTLTNTSTVNFSLAYQDVQTANTVCDNALTISVQFAKGASTVAVTPAYPVQPCDNGKMWISPFY